MNQYLYNIHQLIYQKIMSVLTVGSTADRLYWVTKGQTPANSQSALQAFHRLGLSSRDYQGRVFLLRSFKFLRPGDEITQDHVTIFNACGADYFRETKPTPADEQASPFGPTFVLKRPDGDNTPTSSTTSNNSNTNQTNSKNNDKNNGKNKTKPPDDDTDSEGNMFDLFD